MPADRNRRKPARPAGRHSQQRAGARPGKHRRTPPGPQASAEATGDRLQKVLAAAGVGSRRKCEELITSGRVEVDRHIVTELGTRVQPGQEVRLDGEVLKRSRPLYYVVNKPAGVVSTNYDQAGRPRVVDLLPERGERLFTVGRLDLSSEGLILVTNDGLLAQGLTHPRYGVEKTYEAQVAGMPGLEVIEQLRQGVRLAEGFARPKSVRVKSTHKQSTTLEIVLQEGKNREVRRLLARVGHKVLHLKRTAVGGIKLADLPPGHWRRLYPDEVKQLRQSISASRSRANRPPRAGDTADQSASVDATDIDDDDVIESQSGGAQQGKKPRPVVAARDLAGSRPGHKRPRKASPDAGRAKKHRRH